ncbi:hypothetical protein ACFE04_021181 [Oxalis oulophora]
MRKFYLITIHVVEDIEHVIRNATVAKFMVRDLLQTWFRILSFVQGINPEKRETTFHVGYNDFEADLPFVVARSIGNINSLLVNGAFDLFKQDIDDNIQVPESAIRLTYECLRAIMSWIGFYDSTSIGSQSQQLDLGILNFSEWPNIFYDVSKQEIYVHSPLHRFLFMLLHNVLRRCNGNVDMFGSMLVGCRPHGFSASIMEHPLRVRVFCAQVCARMWSENDVASFSAYWYLDARWLQGLESDLFLLQFCGASAPPDLYVESILGCFGLLEYLFLNLEKSSEYEPDLMKEKLTLIIQCRCHIQPAERVSPLRPVRM